MRKTINIMLTLILCLVLVSCGKKKNDDNNGGTQEPPKPVAELTLAENSVALNVGESYTIKPSVKNYEGTPEYVVTVEDGSVASASGLIVQALKEGSTKVSVSLKSDASVKASFTLVVNKLKPTLSLKDSSVSLKIYETYVIDPTVTNVDGTPKYIFEVANTEIVKVENNVVIPLTNGVTNIKVSLEQDENVYQILNVEVLPIPEIIVTSHDADIVEGDTINLVYEVVNGSYEDVIVSIEDETVVSKDFVALKAGTTKIKFYIEEYEKYGVIVTITVDEKFVPELSVNVDSLELTEEDIYELVIQTNVEGDAYTVTSDSESIKVEGNKLIAVKEGQAKVIVALKDYDLSVEISVVVLKKFVPELSVNVKELELTEEDIYELEVTTNVEGNSYTITSDSESVKVEGNKLIAVKEGQAKVTVSLKDYELSVEISVVVLKKFVPTLSLNVDSLELTEEDIYELEVSANASYSVSADNDNVEFTVSSNIVTIKALKEGTTKLTVKLDEYANECVVEIKINKLIIDETKPEIILDGVEQNVKLNWNKDFDALSGVKAIDDIDGDITENIQVTHQIDNRTYGTYEVIYEVSDKAGNTATLVREVEVVWNYDVEFIGHMGCYYGVANSEEAFIYAASVLKYQALECDVKQTKDGVFVTCHDDTFAGVTLSSVTYEEIKDVVASSSRTAGYPSQYGEMPGTGKYTSTICTLERYLEICKQYGVKAVVELKSSKGISGSDTSRMQALLDLIEQCDMLNDVIFLGSNYTALIWVKQNGYAYIPCQYLVNSCESETVFNRCVQYGFELSINAVSDNSNGAEWIARYQEAGIKVSTWTFTQYTDYSTLQEWIDLGVDYVTVDWHSMHKLNLPDNSNAERYTVRFYDYDGTLLKETKVISGRAAAIPTPPSREGYNFVGWDKNIKKVTSDLNVYAEYDAIEYSITYDNNLYIISKSSFANKQEFVDEFYGDLFDWIKANYSKIKGFSYSNGVYTMTLSSKTATFSNVEELKALDMYVVEKTIGTIIYKPIDGTNSKDYVPVVDDAYFLNTEPYRAKYIEMNAYFLNVINTSYTSYSKTYQQSSGRVQIMFRFHQWAKGTNIVAFNTLPNKYTFKYAVGIEATMPTDHVKYTIEDEFVLSSPVASIAFLGWYDNADGEGEPITKIEKGTTGNLILYAKWEEFTIPDVYSNITYVLNDGTNNANNKATYLEGVSTVLYAPTKDGYDFLGWSLEANSTNYISSINEKTSGDITLYANFEYSKYSITYDLQGGEWGNKVEFTGSAVTSIATTSNSDFWNGYASNVYLFTGSSYSGSLNATWSERIGIAMDETVGTYVVKAYSKSGVSSFDYAGCDYILQLSSSHGKYNSLKSVFTTAQIGYVVRIVGDAESGVATVEFYKPEDISGGKIENFVTEYTIVTIPQVLPTPKYEGKTFKGWATSKGGTPLTSLPETTRGNITLYAIWE